MDLSGVKTQRYVIESMCSSEVLLDSFDLNMEITRWIRQLTAPSAAIFRNLVKVILDYDGTDSSERVTINFGSNRLVGQRIAYLSQCLHSHGLRKIQVGVRPNAFSHRLDGLDRPSTSSEKNAGWVDP